MSKTCTVCGNSGITVNEKKMDDGTKQIICTDCWTQKNPESAKAVKNVYKIRNGLFVFAGIVAVVWITLHFIFNS